MIFAISFLLIHWYLSLFCQSFYLHRYISHRQFNLSEAWDKFFLILTIFSQGPSFLRPMHYKRLHMQHHAFSDEPQDPHSPVMNKNIIQMIKKTFHEYMNLKNGSETFPRMVTIADSFFTRGVFVLLYIGLYLAFTDSYWYLLLVPLHTFLGPLHGAIVNWCGHKYGYRNYELKDNSKNTLVFDFLMMGELYQNNHHANVCKINFADKWYEFDMTYILYKLLKRLKIVANV